MRKLYLLCASISVFAGLALAEDWTGRLVDASCYAQDKSKPCDASSSTTSFLLDVNGKTYKLDASGNSKAATAIKNRADRSAPGAAGAGAVNAKVTGSMEGTDSIKVDRIDVQ